MNHIAIVKYLYPNIRSDQYMFRVDGGVLSIVKWTYLDAPQPTIEELQAYADIGDLLQAQADKNRDLRIACANAITNGFSSSALGEAYNYPAKEGNGYYDQSNLNNAAIASMTPNLPQDWETFLWCEDAENVWHFASHDAEQIQQVLKDFNASQSSARAHLKDLQDQVSECETVEEVEAINW